MTAKCKFCNDTKKEPGVPGVSVWCDSPKASTVRRYTAVELRFATNSAGDYVSAADYDALVAKLADQHRGEPVAVFSIDETGYRVKVLDGVKLPANGTKLYTNTEVIALRSAYLRAGEREHDLRTELAALRTEVKQLRSALADSAERHAPVERDERAEFESAFLKHLEKAGWNQASFKMMLHRKEDGQYSAARTDGAWYGWETRASMEFKPCES